MDSNASIVFATNDENDVFYEDVAGKSGEDATLDKNSLGNNGGTGGGSVVGRAFVDNRQFTHKYLHQGALVHSSTGGGGYGGGGSGSVTTAGAYASDQRWVKYDRGGWAPVGALSCFLLWAFTDYQMYYFVLSVNLPNLCHSQSVK